MGLLRKGDDHGGRRYRMRQKLFSVGDDSWIEDDDGNRVFKVDGKALRVRKTFELKDASGHELLKIQERKLHIHDTMRIERGDGDAATVKKALITPLRERFTVHLADGSELTAKGNIVDHEYSIEGDGEKIAEVSKRWFRVRDTYGIEIAPGHDDALLLAVSVCIDEMSERGR
jgi:uncharacterized protein YxjI